MTRTSSGMPPSARTTVRRAKKRARYDAVTVHAILDAERVAHVGFVGESGPVVIPMVYTRDGDSVLIHGARLSRLATTLSRGVDVCLTVTILDGLVYGYSAFHQSVNYRSVIALGTAVPVRDRQDKLKALKRIVERVAPGRWESVRAPSAKELDMTEVLRLPLDEASAKVRDEGVFAEPAERPVWAGVLPLERRFGMPVTDRAVPAGIPPPDVSKIWI